MRIGKLTNQELESIVLSGLAPRREDVVLRPGIGMDCGAVRMGGEICVVSTDPITAAGKHAGSLAVHICCNDIASTGGEPVGMLLTLLVPPQGTLDEVREVMHDAQRAAASLNVEIVGGHTEVTSSVRKLIISATAMGVVRGGRVINGAGARPGDALIMTKWAGMEGTAILAGDCGEALASVLEPKVLEGAKKLIDAVSVVPEGRMASSLPVTAMHDVTEGGILGAVWEVCEASGCGCRVVLDAIPVLEVTRKICGHFGLDPYRLISSGSMLMAASDPEAVLEALLGEGIPACVIGVCTQEGMLMEKQGSLAPLEPPGSDELYRVVARD